MAGATIAEVRAALAASLTAKFTTTVQVSAYMLANPTPPTIQVMGPDNIYYDEAMQRGLDRIMLIIQGFVGSPMDKGAQVVLDTWLSPSGATSVKAAVEADRTLGGKVQSLQVVSSSGYRIYNLDNRATALGAEWTVSVLNTGT